MNKLMKFFKDEDGLETVEYAIILGLVVVGTIAAVLILGEWVQSRFENVNEQLGAS